jgi:3-oxoacyl-[acyl-carrier protein] reductase
MNEVSTSPQKKQALITGASGALGRAVSLRLARDGFDVWLHYAKNRQAAENLLLAVKEQGGTGRLVQFDIRNQSQIDDVLIPLLSENGPLDVLVNNAGIPSEGYMMMMPASMWEEVISVNLTGFFRVTRACLKGMMQKRSGRIINIGSLAGAKGTVGQTAYAAAKAGLEGATRALAQETARWNILVNTVAPGPLDDGMASADQHEKFIQEIPLKRLGRPEEAAGAVAFLCSEDATYITGQVISVNGGMGM